MTWPEVQAAIDEGCDTVVVALGATVQHGPHLPLSTDALLGDRLASAVAERLGAFVAPTVPIGCADGHLGFAGTLSLRSETFVAVVCDLVESFASAGLRRVVLLPSHSGNLVPLAGAVDGFADREDVDVFALTNLDVLMELAVLGEETLGVSVSDGGMHAGERETSMLLAAHPELVRMDRAEAGFTGDPDAAMEHGIASVSANGVLGDPRFATAEHGERYWERMVQLTVEAVEEL